MILYPTETIYALGVNALDRSELLRLYELKGREEGKSVSWLVRDTSDIAHYGVLTPTATKIAKRFLPGPLTLVLKANDVVPEQFRGIDGTVSFRISSDKVAQAVVKKYMDMYKAPLTCTSANVSGMETKNTPEEILMQFGEKAEMIDDVVDDGPRAGVSSTVIKVIGDQIEILREGAISRVALEEAKLG